MLNIASATSSQADVAGYLKMGRDYLERSGFGGELELAGMARGEVLELAAEDDVVPRPAARLWRETARFRHRPKLNLSQDQSLAIARGGQFTDA